MASSSTPVPVASIDGIMWDFVSAGSTHTCALYEPLNAGTYSTTVYCWGDNSAGQFGDNGTISSVIPVQVFTGPFAPYQWLALVPSTRASQIPVVQTPRCVQD